MADLEHDVRNQPDTIFEAGSVSKQFTAAAVLLLARDGKLSLDDPARKYVPELPDYGAPLTIRHMLNHTSGLRDWGSVAAIAGWPRGTRVHTPRARARHRQPSAVAELSVRHALLLLATPATTWPRSSSRGSADSRLPSSRALRIFSPLGMTRTSWRDDYTRVVKDRAIAYSGGAGGFSHRHAVRERPRQRRAADDGRRPAAVDAQLLAASRRRRAVRQGAADAGTLQRRPAARLRAGAHDRHLSRAARSRAQRLDGRLSGMARRSIPTDKSRWRCCATSAAATRRSTRTPSRISISG